MLAFANGMGLCMGLIISIGPQNLELIRAGLFKDKAYLLASTFVFCDIFLITLGILGVSELILFHPMIEKFLLALTILILLYLALQAFRRINQPTLSASSIDGTGFIAQSSATSVIKKGLLLSVLNPLAILETVIIIGSSASQYQNADKCLFAMGAMFTSATWFYSISFGAQKFSYLFKETKNIKLLEATMGLVLIIIAIWLSRIL
jgi:L-lysine exporter family protein LysE/ArgO